jgi:hypothetical protein
VDPAGVPAGREQALPQWHRVAAPSSPPAAVGGLSVGWITVGTALLAVGIAALLDAAHVLHLSVVQYLALPLLILGLGLLTATWLGRGRWLILPGLLLIPFVLAASLIHVPVTGGFADRVIRPSDVSALRPAYRLVAGQMVLDLSDLPLGSRTVTIRATNVAGVIRVVIPADVGLTVRGRAGAGEVWLFGQTFDGIKVDVQRTFAATQPSELGGRVVLDLETVFGQVVVTR